ncbi:unnamed protein product, partial [Effrenium voratum]
LVISTWGPSMMLKRVRGWSAKTVLASFKASARCGSTSKSKHGKDVAEGASKRRKRQQSGPWSDNEQEPAPSESDLDLEYAEERVWRQLDEQARAQMGQLTVDQRRSVYQKCEKQKQLRN